MLILETISYIERRLFYGRCVTFMIYLWSIPTNPEYMEAWIRVDLQCPWLVVKERLIIPRIRVIAGEESQKSFTVLMPNTCVLQP